MKIGGPWLSIARTCIGEVWVRRTTSSGPGGSAGRRLGARHRGAGGQAKVRVERRRVDVEGVLRHPRRVAGRMVEGREVVVVELDLGALHDAVAEADEDVLDLAHRCGSGGSAIPSATAGVPGRVTSIDSAASPARARAPSSPAASRSVSVLQRLARALAACPTGPRSVGGQLADPPQDPGQLGLASQVADPRAPRARRRRSAAAIAASASPRELVDFPWSVRHGRPSYSRPRTGATAAALATFSESGPSGRIGIRALASAAAATSAGNPSRSAPRHRTSGGSRSTSARTVAAPRVQRELEGLDSARPALRRRPREHRAHAGPDRPAASTDRRSPGPRTTGPVGERVGGADDRPDVAGIADALQIDAESRPPGVASSAGGRPRSRGCPSPASLTASSSSGSTSSPATSTNSAPHPAALGGLDQVLALGDEQPAALAVLSRPELAE